MIEVSIDMITYNHKKYIRQAIESVINQKTNFDFELLIHDDASTDGTKEIIKEYALRYPDIVKPYFEEKNQYSQGVNRIGYTFNIRRAKGRYLASCEGDDFWSDPNKLQYQYDFLEEHKEYSAHFHAAKIVDCNGVWTGHYLGRNGQNEIMTLDESLLKFYPTASKMYRRECFDVVPDFYFIGDAGDFPTQILILLHGNAFYEGKVMSCYRQGVTGSSNDRFKKWSLEKRLNHFEQRITILDELDKYTDYAHTSSIKKYNTILTNNKVKMYSSFLEKICQYKKVRHTEGYGMLGATARMKLMLSDFMPGYSNLVEKKNAIMGRMKGNE